VEAAASPFEPGMVLSLLMAGAVRSEGTAQGAMRESPREAVRVVAREMRGAGCVRDRRAAPDARV
jgi:hypothetical protein